MKLSVIVAVSSNNAIGLNNQLPWHLPADLKHFKKITFGHPVIMGRKTYESIGRPLSGRTNIIITRQLNYEAPNCIIVHSLNEAIDFCKEEEEAFIIGGSEIILHALNQVDKIYLTRINHFFEGDTFFPVLPESKWKEIIRNDYPADEKNVYSYAFIELVRT